MTDRCSGVLLHPSSLPGPYGIGEFGPAAVEWLDFLSAAEQTVWQMLPLNPVDAEGCPYQTHSVLAGNTLLISTHRLVEDGLLERGDLAALPQLPEHTVDYAGAAAAKKQLLDKAHANFSPTPDSVRFCRREGWWLDDYARFLSLSHRYGPDPSGWPAALARHEPAALDDWEEIAAAEMDRIRFEQYVFASHYAVVKEAAHARGVRLFGDIAMYPGVHSTEAWARPDLFQLYPDGTPSAVAGFPPDEFSRDGQVWGNALYRWDVHADEEYAWWVDRIRRMGEVFDIVRLDHFRGFHRYWAVPVPGRAADGWWEDGPGTALFDALRTELGGMSLVAEDLGPASADVQRLRTEAGISGMRLLQFAFSGDENQHLPHYYPPDSVAYTGTHDNDTTAGWWAGAGADERERAERYLGGTAEGICWSAARAVHGSAARLAILPLQDVLGLGSESRLNTPGRSTGNWRWRYDPGELTPGLEFRLRLLTETYGRDRRAPGRRARGFTS